MRRAAALLFAALVAAACAPSLPDAYVRSRAAAERAYSAGRYDEAAREWQKAAATADLAYHRNDARYRAAASLERAGRWPEARRALDAFLHDAPKSSGAARAAYDRANLEFSHGDPRKGVAMLEQVIADHPESAAAANAVRLRLIQIEESGGVAASRAWLDRMIPRFQKTGVGELLHYSYAECLKKQGLLAAARDRYVYVADTHGYPFGDLWDDALFHASELDETLGDAKTAILRLRRMLAERESSDFQGSYERPRFAPAQYRIAELYRDRLGDRGRARREFEKLWNDHPTSLLRDDARWNQALIAAADGDQRDACNTLTSLQKEMPDSRFSACAPLVCPTLAAPKGKRCHRYVARSAAHTLGRPPPD